MAGAPPSQRDGVPAPRSVRLIEVGPRDGLQNESAPVSTETKLELIERLVDAGVRELEVTSFVSARRVPQMADHDDLMRRLSQRPGVRYSVLTPNLRGYQNAVGAGAHHVAVFASASESFSRHNIQCSIDESFARFEPVFAAARSADVPVRGYVSCVLGCPYEGAVEPAQVARVAARLHAAGCYEISLGDTIGVGTPGRVEHLLEVVGAEVPLAKLAGHFHDTYGMAVANVYAAWRLGLRAFDSSVGGLGGCPYAPGATGNVATEDLVYLLRDLGADTGIDLDALVECARWIAERLGRQVKSPVGRALLARQRQPRRNEA